MPTCPTCRIRLCRVEISGFPVHTCSDCGGELIDDLRLPAIARKANPQWTDEQESFYLAQAQEADDPRERLCSRCGRFMKKLGFRDYEGVSLDQCPQCRCYWLDPGELEQIQILYRDTLAHRTEEDWRRVEKMARLNLAMEVRRQRTQEMSTDVPIISSGLHAAHPLVAGLMLVASAIYSGFQMKRDEDDLDAETVRIITGRPRSHDESEFFLQALRRPAVLLTLAAIIAVIAVALWLLLRR